MKKIFFLFIVTIVYFIFCNSENLYAQNLRIRIFSTNNISQISIVPSFGNYVLNETIKLKKQDKIILGISNGKIRVVINNNAAFSCDSVRINSEDLKCFFQITPTNAKMRRYDNNLIVKLTKDKKYLFLINDVMQNNYLAGVIQSEAGGTSDNVEFFKVQAICCRSYMVRFWDKHAKEGYNLCDDINCQVYLSRANKSQCIEGAATTTNEIIVDENDKIIETLFHSNSGGQTANSEDVWSNKISYLRSVTDSFSIGGSNAQWEEEFKEKEWLNYFKKLGVDINDYNIKRELLNFSQAEGRKSKIFSIPLTQVRKDFKLKSTFFDVIPWGSNVKLRGRGYGHGVGMSQEGAAKMCADGYEYWEVIEYYYQGVRIKSILN